MDALDVDILRVMGLQPFLAWPHPPDHVRPTGIARALGVPVGTVKDRVAQMEQSGVISGYELHPNFHHLGVRATTYHFRMGDARPKSEGLEDVAKVEGVVGVFDFLGPTVCVDLAYRHPRELERKVGLVARLLDARTLPHPCFEYAPPDVPRPLTNLDWRIVRALRGRARRRLEDVADELGVSARTVRRRVDRMWTEGSFDVVPVVDTSRISGSILYEMLVTLDDAAQGAGGLPPPLERLCRGALCAAWPVPAHEGRHLCATLLLLARSVAEIDAMRLAAERVPGVRHVEVLIPARKMARPEWVDEAIEARVQATAPAGPAVAQRSA